MHWNLQYEKLIEFKRKNGHCIVPRGCEQDISIGGWVRHQRYSHTKNIMRPDRDKLLVKIGFVWRLDPIAAHTSGAAAHTISDDKRWHQQYATKEWPLYHTKRVRARYLSRAVGSSPTTQSYEQHNATRPKETSGRNRVHLEG